MGILKKLGDILFGKDPDIFDGKGNVRHLLPTEKWKAWDDRIRGNPEYNWRDHTGQHLGRPSRNITETTRKTKPTSASATTKPKSQAASQGSSPNHQQPNSQAKK